MSQNQTSAGAAEIEYLDEVQYGDRTFILSKPLVRKSRAEAGVWEHECEEFGILAYGRTESDSLHDFAMQFASLWDSIALETDDRLTADARALKHLLRSRVQKIQNDREDV